MWWAVEEHVMSCKHVSHGPVPVYFYFDMIWLEYLNFLLLAWQVIKLDTGFVQKEMAFDRGKRYWYFSVGMRLPKANMDML